MTYEHYAAVFCVSLLVCVCDVSAQAAEQQIRRVNIPPMITDQPAKHIPFVIEESIELPCVASGQPRPTYTWYMNDEVFQPSGNDGRIAIQPGVGTLIFARPLARDEAIYQCKAENEAGLALTVKVDLRRGVLEPFASIADREHEVSLGRSLMLPCTPPTSYPKPDIFWATVDIDETFVPVDLDARVSMDPDGNLHFANIRSSDHQRGRSYVCVVQNQVMRRTMHGAYQLIDTMGEQPQAHRPAEAYAHPTHQIALRGDVWRVKCIFYGNPTPTVTWERNIKPMPPRKREESFGQELVIDNIQFEDAGKYECIGINDGADVPIRKSFDVIVESAPFWVKAAPQSVDASEGETARFYCNATGIPEPSIYWYINGDPMAKVEQNDRRTVGRNVLTYVDLKKDDALVVQCNATNKHGYIFANAYLNVLSEPPTITHPPLVDQKAAEGQTVNLNCSVYGSPKPLVVWRKGNEQLTGGRFRVLPDGHLQINDVSLVDAGTYTCTATNKFDTVSARGSLIVRRRTLIRTPPLDVMVFAGTEAKFTCTATTDPEEVHNLKIVWKKDGQVIDYRYAQRMFENTMDNSLTISGTYHRDTARYTCMAENGLDSDESSAQLIVQDVPDEPNNVEVLCYNQQRTADITWQPGKENYAPILNFIVQYNTTFASDTWIDISTNVSVTSRKLNTTLSPFGNYTFRVLARNKIGLSPPSLHTVDICTTEKDLPEKNPENVIGEGDEPNNLVVYWTPMPKIEHNSAGFYYLIRWQLNSSDADEDPESLRVPFPEAYHQVLPGSVETYQPYRISVKAGNSVGESRAAAEEIIGYSGEDIPTSYPTDLQVEDNVPITGTTATISFIEPDTGPDAVRGFFRGYRVQFWRTIDGEDGLREQDHIINKPKQYPRPRERRAIDDGRVTLELDNLPPYSEITVQVRLLNKYYASRASNRISFTTRESEPGPPADFQVSNRGSTHVDLEWSKPREENGRIVGYQMSYQIITGLNLGRIQYRDYIDNATIHRAQLTGLKPSTDYRIYLRAATIIGQGEDIFLDTVTSPGGKPSPATFDIVDVGPTYVNVSWTPSRSGNPGSVFYVQFRPRGSYHWLHTTDEELDYKMSIEGLNKGTGYQIRVVAKDGEGEETPAEWQMIVTGGVAPGRDHLPTSGWFWGIWVSLLIIIILIVLFLFLKRIRDDWWERKEAEIEEQMRQIQAEDAAYEFERGFVNDYAKGSQENVAMDTSQGSDYKPPPMNYEGASEYKPPAPYEGNMQYKPPAQYNPPERSYKPSASQYKQPAAQYEQPAAQYEPEPPQYEPEYDEEDDYDSEPEYDNAKGRYEPPSREQPPIPPKHDTSYEPPQPQPRHDPYAPPDYPRHQSSMEYPAPPMEEYDAPESYPPPEPAVSYAPPPPEGATYRQPPPPLMPKPRARGPQTTPKPPAQPPQRLDRPEGSTSSFV